MAACRGPRRVRYGGPVTEQASAPKPQPAPRRSPEEVSADLETARQSLLGHVDAITEHMKPSNVASRGFAPFRRVFVSDEGKPNVRNIAITVGVVAVYVLYRIRR